MLSKQPPIAQCIVHHFHKPNPNLNKNIMNRSFIRLLLVGATASMLANQVATAHPYASGTYTNGDGNVYFFMNEAGANVTVTFEDLTTTNLGVLPKGQTNFYLGTHTSYSISCYKQGNGTPSVISTDTDTYSTWNSARGVAVNKNAAIGANFGRLCVGNGATGAKAQGLYLLNSDQTLAKGPVTASAWASSGAGNAPWRVRANNDGSFLVSDFSTPNATIYQFTPDLSNSNLVFLLGQNMGPTLGVHGDFFGCGIMKGSLAQGNLRLYTFDSGMGTPADTNCIKGPLTSEGSYNCVFIYNIGSGPLPWNKRPDYAYTYGLDGIAELRTEGDVGNDGKIYCGFGRANASNPNLQILRPPPMTNGITFDPYNADVQDAAKSATNWLYTGGVTPPFNTPPPGAANDPWAGNRGSGVNGGTYAGVRVSPDGQYIASVDINNGITIASLTNGIPNDGTIFGISQGTFGSTSGLNLANSRGMDWDPANNIWVISSGQGLLRCWSLGLTTTCITSNDWTGTNGSFAIAVPPLKASVAATTRIASQNYVNNTVNAGTPIPGVFRISLANNDTTATGPVTVSFVRTGTGVGPSGGIASITVTNGGINYTSAPAVTFTGGGGSGAAATATLTGSNVTAVTVTSPGTGYTAAPTIGFTGGGGSGAGATASITLNGTSANYIINTNETPNGVTVRPNSVTFPAGVFSGSNGPNWNVDVKIIPTATPVSGPTLAVNLRLLSGTNYAAAAPLNDSIAILNTGPQLLQLSAAAPATLGGMNRGIPDDYARFVITRLGDTNGPNNDAVNPIVARSLTVSSIRYLPPSTGSNFYAKLGTDFTAGAQNFNNALPVDGSPGIVIPAGAVTVNAMIGNPVKHADTSITRTNLQVVISLTNICDTVGAPGCNTNLLSAETLPYQVTTTSLVLNEFDNALGGEVVLWSNPLTNALDSTNWTLVYANINQGGSPTLPTVISNYDNSANVDGLEFYARFGKPVNDAPNDGGVTVPQSDTMAARNWTTALKVSVNKNPGNAGESGINLYPQIPGAPWSGNNYMVFQGNYALRFDMFLSLYDFGLNNPTIGTPAREFAAFGMNHHGTNANWRLDINPRADGTGGYPINADGEWCAIGAASGSITPADYDMFISPAWALFEPNGVPITNTVPFNSTTYVAAPFTNAYQSSPGFYTGVTNLFANAGVPNDQQSANNNAFGGAPQNGIIKNPPFSGINNLGGAPDNAWVDVSLELTRQTNLSLKLAQQQVFATSILTPLFGVQNPLAPYGGTPMLGYLDPNRNISDYSAFVYYSNLRVVELSPFIPWTNQPVAGLIVTPGTSFTLSSGATFASNPLTNVWYVGTTNGAFPATTAASIRQNGTPTAGIATNVFAATNGIATLAVDSLQSATNYISVWSDQAGSVTNLLTVVEMVVGPTNKTVNAGVNADMRVFPSGNAPPTAYQWYYNSVSNFASATPLPANNHIGAPTSARMWVTNVQSADAGYYWCAITNLFSYLVPEAAVLATPAPSGATVIPANLTTFYGSNASFTVSVPGGATSWQWKRYGTNLADGGNVSGATTATLTVANVTGEDQTAYTAGVTNFTGGTLSSAGNLKVVTAPLALFVSGGNQTFFFTGTSTNDTVSSFTLQASPDVTGPYTNTAAVVVTNSAAAMSFQITIPGTAERSMFYRLLRP